MDQKGPEPKKVVKTKNQFFHACQLHKRIFEFPLHRCCIFRTFFQNEQTDRQTDMLVGIVNYIVDSLSQLIPFFIGFTLIRPSMRVNIPSAMLIRLQLKVKETIPATVKM